MSDAPSGPMGVGGTPPARPPVFDVQGFARKYIPFSSRFVSGQKSGHGQWLTATFAVANTNTAFTIALGRIPAGYLQYKATVGGIVFSPSTTAWTPNSITLQATVAGTYSLWIG